MQRYFLQQDYHQLDSSQLTVPEDVYHHMIHVMRMKPGDCCYLVYLEQLTIQAEIITIDSTNVWLKEVGREMLEKELPIEVGIACGYLKGDKFEWVVQKATELGASQFYAFQAQSSVAKWDEKKRLKKTLRLEKIAQEAAEQSHRQLLPRVDLLGNLAELMHYFSTYDQILVADEEAGKAGELGKLAQSLKQVQAGDKLLVIFGPEGGFARQEIEKMVQAGACVCGLGPRILRAETAPLYVLSAISYQLELLKD